MKLLNPRSGDARPSAQAGSGWPEAARMNAHTAFQATDPTERAYTRLAIEFMSKVAPSFVKEENSELLDLVKDALKSRRDGFIADKTTLTSDADNEISAYLYRGGCDVHGEISSVLDVLVEKFDATYQLMLAARATETVSAAKAYR